MQILQFCNILDVLYINEWMDGCVGGWMDGWMDARTDRQKSV